MARTRFTVLQDQPETETSVTTVPAAASRTDAPAPDPAPSALAFALLALRVLSQRSVQLAANLLPLIALATGCALWWRAMPGPTLEQLAGLALYAVFMLLMLMLRR